MYQHEKRFRKAAGVISHAGPDGSAGKPCVRCGAEEAKNLPVGYDADGDAFLSYRTEKPEEHAALSGEAKENFADRQKRLSVLCSVQNKLQVTAVPDRLCVLGNENRI